LDADELKRLLAALSITGTPVTRLAMRLLLLTSVRTAELRGSTWKEIDLESAIWAIPGERMKMGHPPVVPLSTQAIMILKEVPLYKPCSSCRLLHPKSWWLQDTNCTLNNSDRLLTCSC
jgi:integrase